MERARAVVLSCLALAVLARGSAAQTCPFCPGAATLPAHVCTLPGVIQEGTGCGGQLKNCQTPELLPPRIRVISSGTNTFEAQLAVEARAPWNSDSGVLSAGRIKLFWGSFDLCENGATDRPETYLAFGGLTCAGAPYNLGTYSLNAVVCQGGGSCQKSVQVTGMVAAVSKAMLCPEPPKWTCCGDGSCRDCIQVGPGFASPAGEGASASPPFSGPGAVLSYRAGGVGGTGWPGSAAWNTALGRHWAHTFSERIVQDPGVGHVWLLGRDATFREFTDSSLDGTYETVSPTDEHRDLFKVPTGWELRSLDGTVESFDAAGLWTQTVDRNGNAKVAQYTAGVLTRVTLPDGRREDFEYRPGGKLKKIVEVGVDGTTSRTWTYTWTGNDLTRIDRPDGTAWELFYSNAALPGYLTRIDLRGTTPGSGRVETAWEYDVRGNVVKIWRGDPDSAGPNAVDLHLLAFDTVLLPTRTSVTDALGRTLGYYFQRDSISRKPRLVRFDDGCPACGSKALTKYEYADAASPLLPTAVVDGNSNRTEHTYNADGRMLTRTEAAGTALSRQTRWEYDPVFRAFPTLIERPSTAGGSAKRKTLLFYDAEGNLLTRTEQGTEAGSSFSLVTTMTYNGAGQVLTIDPPGQGTADLTTFTYDASRGDLIPLSRTDPLVGTTLFSHDPLNRRTGVTDVNGVATLTVFDNLNRVTSVAQDGGADPDLVTTYEHDGFGELIRTTRPRGNVVEYGRDDMGRLTSIELKPDAATPGERTLYTLDKAGHRTQEDLQSWNGSAWVTQATTQYDWSSKCHPEKVIRPGAVTEQTWSCNGEVLRVWDANHPRASNVASRKYEYDALNRLLKVTQPDSATGDVTSYSYDVQDHLTQVTDAEKNLTTYTYGDRDLLTQEISPVSGTRSYVYNEHGELVQETDARGVVVSRTHDALDRVTAVTHPDPSLDVTYAYDAPGTFSKGHLTGITRHGETIGYDYDRFGRLTQDGALTYGYDANGNRTTIGYPDDIAATYTYDHADRQKTLTLTVDGGPPLNLASNATYKPFGPLTSLSLGNGLTETRTYDQRYQPAGIQVSGGSTLLNWSYSVDAVGNITAITDLLNPANNRAFTYQDLYYFLTQGNGPWGPRTWTYDKIGDRLTEKRGAVTDTYAYPANAGGGKNPKLQSVAEGDGGARQYSYDAAGNTQQILDYDLDQRLDLIHDGAGRLAYMRFRAPVSKLVAMTYDGRGFLSKAEDAGGGCFAQQTLATYSSEGVLHRREHRLLDGAGSSPDQSDTLLYFDGKPMADLRKNGGGSVLSYLSNDHLGVPVLSVSDTGTLAWQGGLDPFGGDYSGANAAEVFLRLPGQWDDDIWSSSEGGFYYNVHRWYGFGAGRYAQPDPAGQRGETNDYVYGKSNPVTFIDPLGEKSRACCAPIAGGLLRTWKHCFIETVDESTGKSTTFSLHGMGSPRRSFGGPVGCTFQNDGFDVDAIGKARTECGPWSEDCTPDDCVKREFVAYPSPSLYQLLGPNSNTFAGHVTSTCGLKAPTVAGTAHTPGWGQPLPPQFYWPSLRGLAPMRCPSTR
jgi:RHS repeat-associated protein